MIPKVRQQANVPTIFNNLLCKTAKPFSSIAHPITLFFPLKCPIVQMFAPSTATLKTGHLFQQYPQYLSWLGSRILEISERLVWNQVT
jgi:hypothetical protein